MHVNWFTVIAQIINFLALAWLLSRYLYKPILHAIEERENKILAQLNDAQAKVKVAEKEHEEFRQKNEAFENQRNRLLQQAIAESDLKRQELLEAARKDAAILRSNLEISLKEAHQNSNKKIALRIQQEVIDLSRKAIKDIASSGLEEQAIGYLQDKINQLSTEERLQFTNAFKVDNKAILIRSAFEVNPDSRIAIKESIESSLNAKFEFQFETTPELICGIELVSNGFKLGWNLSSYFDSLEKNIEEASSEKLKSKSS